MNRKSNEENLYIENQKKLYLKLLNKGNWEINNYDGHKLLKVGVYEPILSILSESNLKITSDLYIDCE